MPAEAQHLLDAARSVRVPHRVRVEQTGDKVDPLADRVASPSTRIGPLRALERVAGLVKCPPQLLTAALEAAGTAVAQLELALHSLSYQRAQILIHRHVPPAVLTGRRQVVDAHE